MPKRKRFEPAEAFNALGRKKWREYWEADYHTFGKYVFDEGKRPSGKPEEGFLHSIEATYRYVGEHLSEPLTVEMYQEIHRLATSHFQGQSNNTLADQSKSGKFRDKYNNICYNTNQLLMQDIVNYLYKTYKYVQLYDRNKVCIPVKIPEVSNFCVF